MSACVLECLYVFARLCFCLLVRFSVVILKATHRGGNRFNAAATLMQLKRGRRRKLKISMAFVQVSWGG